MKNRRQASGNGLQKKEQAVALKQTVSSKMTSAQMNEAKKLVKNWKSPK